MNVTIIQEQNTKLINEVELLNEELQNTTDLMLKKSKKVKKLKRKIRKLQRIITQLIEELEDKKV